MDLNRFTRIVRQRWLVLVVFVLIGMVTAVVVTQRQNDAISPTFEAVAVVVYPQDPLDANNQTLATRLEEARVRAVDANSEAMNETPGAQILPVADLGELQFQATGSSEAEARSNALGLRSNFLDAEQAGTAGGLEDELASIVEDIVELQTRLNELQEPTAEQQRIASDRATLESQISALRNLATQLRVELAQGSSERTETEIESELSSVEQDITTLTLELGQLEVSDPAHEARDQLQVRLLQRQIDVLESRYQELFFRQEGHAADITPGRVQVVDRTPAPASRAANGAVGGFIGALVAVGILMLLDRLSPRVWGQRDVPAMQVVTEVPKRKPNATGPIWYEVATRERRKLAVQQVRAAVEARISDSSTLAISGVELSGCDVAALATDVAVAMSVSGRSVLLLEVDFDNPCGLYEFSASETDVATLGRQLAREDSDLKDWLRDRIEAVPEIRPGFKAIPAGRGIDNAADALAAREFSVLLNVAAELADLVIVAGPQASSPGGRTVLQRTDVGLLIVPEGKVGVVELELLVAELPSRRVEVLGLAMIMDFSFGLRLSDRFSQLAGAMRRDHDSLLRTTAIRVDQRDESSTPPVEPDREKVSAPADIGKQEETSKAWTAQTTESLMSVDMAVGAIDHHSSQEKSHEKTTDVPRPEGPLSRSAALLEELRSLPVEHARSVAEGFLIEGIELAVCDPGPRLGDSWRFVDDFGMVPLVDTGVAPTLRRLLMYEMGSSIREVAGHEAWRELSRLLCPDDELDDGEYWAVSELNQALEENLDGWIAEWFFREHVRRTKGQPTVWHLTSKDGHMQVFVDAYKFDGSRIASFRTDVLQPHINSLYRRSRVPDDSYDLYEPNGSADETRLALEDVRGFDRTLGKLLDNQDGGSPRRYPWLSSVNGWQFDSSRGVRPALAPLQRLGLLAIPLLGDDELRTYEPPET